jgi:hypothetical protein
MKNIILYLFFVISFFLNQLVLASELKDANDAFEKKDYSTALSDYQTALNNHVPQTSSQTTPVPSQTPTLTKRILSYFIGTSQPVINPNSRNAANGYICLRMGECYIQEKQIGQAVSVFGMGVSIGGDNEMGNRCLYEEGFYQMYQLNYQGAYQSMREYVKRNVDKDPKSVESQKMKYASYVAMVCAWKLNKEGQSFDSNMSEAVTLALKGKGFLAGNEGRVYFKKAKAKN